MLVENDGHCCRGDANTNKPNAACEHRRKNMLDNYCISLREVFFTSFFGFFFFMWSIVHRSAKACKTSGKSAPMAIGMVATGAF